MNRVPRRQQGHPYHLAVGRACSRFGCNCAPGRNFGTARVGARGREMIHPGTIAALTIPSVARTPARPPADDALQLPQPGLAFLLSTLGWHSHALWAERLKQLRLDAREAAMLLHVASAEGKPQQVLVRALRIPASRVVALVDDLEQRRLLQRRGDPADRRVRKLHLTPQGRRVVRQLTEVSRAHEAALSAGLEPAEREQLVRLLRKSATALHLSLNIHAGLAGGDWRGP